MVSAVSLRHGFGAGLGWKNRHDLRVGRIMWIMAMHTIIPCPAPSTEIPVTVHSTVASIVVIAELWTVTLGAKLHNIGKLHG